MKEVKAMKNLKSVFSKPLNIKNNVYALESAGNGDVDLTFYGDVVVEQPIDWWTGAPIEGNFIILNDFLEDLDRLDGFKNITIHMNSYGGDCMAGFTIHNKLRELSRAGKKLTCVVDGVAMSSASLIMSACDTVKVNPASLVMIHKCWSTLIGGYNADELLQMAEQNSTYDRAIASAYVRKTGVSEEEILRMMSETTYMTGSEAVEKGFADELIDDAEPVKISASADGQKLYVHGKCLQLAPGMVAPDFIPTASMVSTASVKTDAENNITKPANPGNSEGGITMTKDELRNQYPDLVAEIVADASASNAEATNNAVNAERQRLADIDQIAGLYAADAVNEAKYGATACSASEFALRMAQEAAKKGASFMADVADDSQESGTEDVPSAVAEPTPTTDEHDMSETEIKDFMSSIFKKN